ncbi:hypothetical protein BC936DRAFT_139734 [Jimgerdemannia flammicorona]|uniref:Uncharacterized protein n=1 Tax=Jimgerdemannia flammicorona TaxID=994334 RepID=A0A433DHI1_9FUNG|nr:hypothetical protein BC936DRAFT_139734 [Jimgerdemannia flammicorona]
MLRQDNNYERRIGILSTRQAPSPPRIGLELQVQPPGFQKMESWPAPILPATTDALPADPHRRTLQLAQLHRQVTWKRVQGWRQDADRAGKGVGRKEGVEDGVGRCRVKMLRCRYNSSTPFAVRFIPSTKRASHLIIQTANFVGRRHHVIFELMCTILWNIAIKIYKEINIIVYATDKQHAPPLLIIIRGPQCIRGPQLAGRKSSSTIPASTVTVPDLTHRRPRGAGRHRSEFGPTVPRSDLPHRWAK